MQPTATGLVLVPVALLALLLRPGAIPFLLVAFTGFSATAVANVPALTFGLQPYHLFAGLFLLLFLAGRFTLRPDAHSTNIAVLLALFLLGVTASLIARSLGEGVAVSNLAQTMLLAIGLLTAAMVAFHFGAAPPEALFRALEVFAWAALFVALWGLFQLACAHGGLAYPAAIFNNSMSDSADLFDQRAHGAVRIASVAIEPSFFARHMVAGTGIGLTLVGVCRGARRRAFAAVAAVCGITAIASTSTSAYVGLLALLLPWSLGSVRRFLAAAAGGVLTGAALALLFPARLAAIVSTSIDKASSGSFYERTQTVSRALGRFEESIAFGHGWDRLEVYDLAVALLYHTGAFGALAFGALVLYALWGGGAPSAAADPPWGRPLVAGLRLTFAAVLAVDAASGISYVAANLWVVMGLLLAAHASRRGAAATEGARPRLVAGRHEPASG